jgi:hypothetical protein
VLCWSESFNLNVNSLTGTSLMNNAF